MIHDHETQVKNFIANTFPLMIKIIIGLSLPILWIGLAEASPPPIQTTSNTVLISKNNTSGPQVRRGRVGFRKRPPIQPEYENCKGKDIYKLDSEIRGQSHEEETEASAPCVNCKPPPSADISSLQSIQQVIRKIEDQSKIKTKNPYGSFKNQLRQSVLGQIKTKIAQTEKLRCCIKGGKESQKCLAQKVPHLDWSLMKAVCKKETKDLQSSIESRWSDMRMSLALASINANQILTSHPNLSAPLSHAISDFGSISKLSEKEQHIAKSIWAERLSNVSLDSLSSEELKSQFLRGEPLRQVSSKDFREMKRATWDLQRKNRDRYYQILEEVPLLAYLKTGDPHNKRDMDQALSKIKEHLDELLSKVQKKDIKDVDMSLLLSFEPLVESLLKENDGYCLAAEGARLKAKREKNLNKWGLTAVGVAAAVPCFITGPLGAAVCLGAGLTVGATGYSMARETVQNSLGQALTRKDFETIASLAEKDNEAFWELMLLPAAAWGTTAGTIKFGKDLFKKGVSYGKRPSHSSELASSKSAVHSANPTASHITGIASFKQTLVRSAETSLGENLSPQQIEALEAYPRIIRGEVGKNGEPAGVGNYTVGQMRRMIRFLEKKFSPAQVRSLIEDGVVEVNRINPSMNSKRVLRRINKGEKFITYRGGYLFETGKVLEKTKRGIVVEMEGFDPQTGQLSKQKWFFVKKDTNTSNEMRTFKARGNILNATTDRVSVSDSMSQILERTNNGFVVDMRRGNDAFFSFEEAIKNGLLPKNPTNQDYRKLEDLLNHYMSRNLDQIPAFKGAKYSINNELVVTDNKTAIVLQKALENSLIVTQPGAKLQNPEFKSIISAAQSTREKVSMRDLNLSSFTNKETQMAAEGYKANFAGGIDDVSQWAEVRRQLQELKANPRVTHIEYFAKQVPEHIAHIKRGLKQNYTPHSRSSGTRKSQLKQLKDLEKEAKKAIHKGRVTYEWWLNFNNQLSEIMSGGNLQSPGGYFIANRIQIQQSLSEFPLKFMVPTTRDSNLGIIAFNRAGVEGIYPTGLANTPRAHADGIDYNTAGFFGHDITHSNLQGNKSFSAYSASHRLFHRRLLENMERLPPRKRKITEGIYFILTHENFSTNLASYPPEKIKALVKKEIRSDQSGVFKLPEDRNKKQERLDFLSDNFMDVYNRTQQHISN